MVIIKKFVVIIILVPEVSTLSISLAKFATVVNVAIAIRKFSDSDIKSRGVNV